MIYINLLQIAEDQQSINVSVSTNVGDTITSVKYWSRSTYKDYSQALDLTSKLLGTSNQEVFSITLSDVGEDLFDDVYFVEFTSSNTDIACPTCPGNTLLGIAAIFSKYQKCLLNKVLQEYDSFNYEELKNCNNINNTFILLENVKISFQSGYYTEGILLLNILDKLCTGTNCTSCQDLQTPIYFSGLNYSILDNDLTLF